MSEPAPELNELQQREDESPDNALHVCVDEVYDPIRTQQLPATEVVMGNVSVPTDGVTAVHVVPDDKRRSRLLLMPIALTGDANGNIIFAQSKEVAENGGGAIWPVRPPGAAPPAPLELRSTKGVWARMPAGDTSHLIVSYVAEYWAD